MSAREVPIYPRGRSRINRQEVRPSRNLTFLPPLLDRHMRRLVHEFLVYVIRLDAIVLVCPATASSPQTQ